MGSGMSESLATACTTVGLAALLSFMAVGGAGAQKVSSDRLIKPLLPQKGDFACYKGTYAGANVDIEDWAKGRSVDSGGLKPDGTPAKVIEFDRTPSVPLHGLTLRLDFDSRKASYDWIFNFTLVADTSTLGVLHARGECPWYDKPYKESDSNYSVEPNTLSLGCGIDCDGGSMLLTRLPSQNAMHLEFSDLGLLMKRGCGGGGRFRVYPAKASEVLRLERVPKEQCKSLKNLK